MSSRPLLALLVFAGVGCPSGTDSGPVCLVDEECGGNRVCARDHFCASPSSVREVTVTWSVDGQPANAMTCAGRSFTVGFYRDDLVAPLEFTPVQCSIGQFFVDKLPRTYTSVAVDNIEVAIRSDGTATVDL